MKKYIAIHKRSKRFRIITALGFILWVAFLMLSHYLSTTEINNLEQNELTEVTNHYEVKFKHYNDIVNLLDALIVEHSEDMEQENLVEVLDNLDNTTFDYITVTQTSIVEFVFPQSYYEDYVGFDVFNHSDSYQREEIANAIISGNIFYQYEITDSVEMVYIRKAILVDGEYYGLITLAVSPSMLSTENVIFESQYLDSSLLTDDGDLIVGTGKVEDYRTMELEFGDSSIYIGGHIKETYLMSVYIEYSLYLLAISVILLIGHIYIYSNERKIKVLDEELDYRQNYDSVTGLYSVERLYSDIEKLEKQDNEFHIAFLNITNLKYISEKFGYYTTTSLVKKTTHLIDRVLRENATMYRHGGDEYVIAIKNATISEVSNLFRRITKIFDNDISINNIRARLGLTVGIACYPEHGKTPEELIKNAHLASNQISSYDKDVFKFYEADRTNKALDQEAFDKQVKDLNLELFEVYLMPIVDVKTNIISGFECLTRAFDQLGSKLHTEQVVLSLERNGRIQELDEIVFKKMLQIMKRINKQFPEQEFFLSLNASALSVNDEYVDNIISYYRNSRIKKGQIVLELTESYRVEDYDYLIKLFNKLIDNGIKVAIDDFGSGYSSISYIAKFPVYAIKVDKEYVRDYQTNKFNRTLLKTLKSIAETLECKLVAEGVDSPETLDYLKEAECPFYQGYYFSKGVPLEDAFNLITKNLPKENE